MKIEEIIKKYISGITSMEKTTETKLYETGKDIAKRILTQIHSIDKWALNAWGASEFISLSDPPGIQFKVIMGRNIGKVIIRPNCNDLYDIEFGTIQKYQWTSKKKVHDICTENLVDIIDSVLLDQPTS